MLQGLDRLDKYLTVDKSKPTTLEFVYYLFWEHGISLDKFNELPLPYIFGILKTYNYVKSGEEKAYKKATK